MKRREIIVSLAGGLAAFGCRAAVAESPSLMSVLESTKAGRARANRERRDLSESEKSDLMNDAKVAWGYFAKFSKTKTGMAPASVSVEGRSTITYPLLTMWDCGSHLLALVASHSLELISDREFVVSAKNLLSHLHDADAVINGSRLPRPNMSVTGALPDESGYDSSDMGRLLIALKVAEDYANSALDAAKVVSRWDLANTILDGRIQNIKRGRFSPSQDSSYANYTYRGYALWGFDVDPPITATAAAGSDDEALQIIEAYSLKGPIGTEPHVLEEIELGHSNASRLISDVLYEAQIKRYLDTGRFVSVSEGPLDRAPWFTYQGYQLLGEWRSLDSNNRR